MAIEKIGVQLTAQDADSFVSAIKSANSAVLEFTKTIGAAASFSGFANGAKSASQAAQGLGSTATATSNNVTDLGSKASKTSSNLGDLSSGGNRAKQSIGDVGTTSSKTQQNINDLGTGANRSKQNLTDLATGADKTKTSTNDLGQSADKVKTALTDAGQTSTTTASKLNSLTTADQKTANSFRDISSEGQNAGKGLNTVADKAGQAAPKVQSVGKEATTTSSLLKTLGDATSSAGQKFSDMAGRLKDNVFSSFKEGAEGAVEKIKELGASAAEKLPEIAEESVKLAGNYQESMLRVKFLTGSTADEMARYNKAAIEIGMTTTFSSGKAADALAQLAQQGIKGSEAIDLLKTSANAAMTNNTDLTTATTQLTTTVKSMGQPLSDAGHDLDVMTKASQLGKINFDDFNNIMSRVGGVAQSSGQSFEEVTAAILSMTNAGVSSNQAANQLKGILVSLEKPNTVAAAAIKQLGLSIYDSTGKMRPFSDIVEQLQEKTANLTQEEKNLALAQIFGKGNIVGITDAMNAQATGSDKGADSLRNWTKQLKESDGTAKSAADTIMSGFNAAFKNMQGSIEEAQITLGTALLPSLTGIVKEVGGIINSFIEWEQETHTIGNVLATLGQGVTVLIHILEGVGGVAIKGFGALSDAIGGAAKAEVGFFEGLTGHKSDIGQTADQLGFLFQHFGELDKMKAVKVLQETGAEFAQVGDKIYDVNGDIAAYIQSNQTAAQAVDNLRNQNEWYRAHLEQVKKGNLDLIDTLQAKVQGAKDDAAAINQQAAATEAHREKLLNLENQVEASEKGTRGYIAALNDDTTATTVVASGYDTMTAKATNDKLALDNLTTSLNTLTGALNDDQKALSTANTMMNNLKDAADNESPAIQKAYADFQTYTLAAVKGGQGSEEARAKAAGLRSELESAHNPKLLAAADAFATEAQQAQAAKNATVDDTVAVVNASQAHDKQAAAVKQNSQEIANLNGYLFKHRGALNDATEATVTVSTATTTATGKAQTFGNTLGTSGATGAQTFTSKIGELPRMTEGEMDKVASAVKRDYSKQTYGTGSSIIDGMDAGVAAGAQRLAAAATAAVTNAIAAAKAALGIHSPSTVARDLIGTPVIQGVEVGVVNEAPKLQAVISDAVVAGPRQLQGDVVGAGQNLGSDFMTNLGNVIGNDAAIIRDNAKRAIQYAESGADPFAQNAGQGLAQTYTESASETLSSNGPAALTGSVTSILQQIEQDIRAIAGKLGADLGGSLVDGATGSIQSDAPRQLTGTVIDTANIVRGDTTERFNQLGGESARDIVEGFKNDLTNTGTGQVSSDMGNLADQIKASAGPVFSALGNEIGGNFISSLSDQINKAKGLLSGNDIHNSYSDNGGGSGGGGGWTSGGGSDGGGGAPVYGVGTNFHRGGFAIVADEGPEMVRFPGGMMRLFSQPALVNLPRGSQVFDTSRTAQMVRPPASFSQMMSNVSTVNSNNVTNQYNLTTTTPMQSQGVVSDFYMMQSWG